MTYPWQLHIGNVDVPLHPLFETLGIFTGFRYFIFLRKRKADLISASNRTWIIIGALFGSFIGSRLIGGLENPIALFHSSNIFFHFYQNKTILGGLLGGVAGVELIKLRLHEKTPSGDLFTAPIILAMIIGRIGCFSMGIYEDTFGLPSDSFFAMRLGDDKLRHPVTLYEIAFLILLWISLAQVKRIYVLAPGALFKLFMIAYLFFRFFLDFLKPHYNLLPGLSTIQIASLCGLAYYFSYIIKPKKLLSAYA